ncbi:MAG: hypothetical protein V7K92_27930 [Nostoc sp.]
MIVYPHQMFIGIGKDARNSQDAINRRLYKNQSFVETAIYRVS